MLRESEGEVQWCLKVTDLGRLQLVAHGNRCTRQRSRPTRQLSRFALVTGSDRHDERSLCTTAPLFPLQFRSPSSGRMVPAIHQLGEAGWRGGQG